MAKSRKLAEALSPAKFFRLHYHISNNGDGSASVRLHSSEEEANKADEEMEEGWGERCSSYETIKLENGKLYYQKYDWDSVAKKMNYIWIPLEEVEG